MARKNQFPARQYTTTHASCSKCKSMKPFAEFSHSKSQPKGISYWCKLCSAANARYHHKLNRSNNPTYKVSTRNRYTQRRYGITLQEYTELLQAQSNKCAICELALLPNGSGTHLDHCHQTGKLRAFLCTNCNRGLGHFKDSEEFLIRASSYLRTHSVTVGGTKEATQL